MKKTELVSYFSTFLKQNFRYSGIQTERNRMNRFLVVILVLLESTTGSSFLIPHRTGFRYKVLHHTIHNTSHSLENFKDFLSPLYGEWSLWHASTNTRSFVGPNKVIVYLYPHSKIELIFKRTIGPVIFKDHEVGNFKLYVDNGMNDGMNGGMNGGMNDGMNGGLNKDTVMIHSYGHSRNKIEVMVEFERRKRLVVSIFGVGVEELNIYYPVPLRIPGKFHREVMEVSVVGNDDIFLTTNTNSSYLSAYHLIRSTSLNQPTINVPFTTLVFTQIVSMCIAYLVHRTVMTVMTWYH